jgi:dihydrofolate reductase
MENKRKLIVYIACSLDGFIAGPGDDLSFLKMVEKTGEDYGYKAFMDGIDTVIMGRRTYDWVMKEVSEYLDKSRNIFILSSVEKPPVNNVQFYNGEPAELLGSLRSKEGKDIFIDGGAMAIDYFRERGLIDEWIISIIPVLLGGGVRLFKEGHPQQQLTFISAKHFETGLVQLHYRS